MTREQLQALAAYARMIADRIELRDWTIVIAEDPIDADSDIEAHIEALYGRKFAKVKFHTDFVDRDAPRQRYVVTHELVHLHLERIADVVDNGPEEIMGKPAFQIFNEQFRTAVEYAVDGVAESLAPLLPLIDWEYRPEYITANDVGGDLKIHPWRANPYGPERDETS